MRPKSRIRRVIPLLGLSAGTCLLLFLLAEVGFRVFAPGQNIPQREFDSRLGWRGRPNLECVLREKLFSISISQNDAGFRDRDRARVKPEDAVRILCCGDSFTWGWGVEQNAIYTSILERRLSDTGHRMDVVNAGVGGYSTDQVLIFLRDEGLDYSPDLVVYQAAQNDIAGNTSCVAEGLYLKPRFVVRESGGLELTNCPVPAFSALGRLKYAISRKSRLAYFVKHRLHLARFMARPGRNVTDEADRRARDSAVDDRFRLFSQLLSTMNGECEARGARFAVLLDFEPSPEQLEHLRKACPEVSIHFLRDHLCRSEERHGAPAFIENDGHWTENGHWWVADYLLTTVLPEEGILPGVQTAGAAGRW